MQTIWWILIIIVVIVVFIIIVTVVAGLRDPEHCPTTLYTKVDQPQIKTVTTKSTMCNTVHDCNNSTCTGSGQIWHYEPSNGERAQYKPVVEVPSNLTLINIEVYDRLDSYTFGQRLPIFYGQDIETGLYRWNGIPHESTLESEKNWVNVAPGTFSYNYPGLPIPTQFELIDFAVSDSGRVYTLYKGETVGPGSLQNIWVITEVVARDSDLPNNEIVMAQTTDGKLISYNTNQNLKIEGYMGNLYGIQSTLNNKSGLIPLTDLTSLDARSSNSSNDDVLVVNNRSNSVNYMISCGLAENSGCSVDAKIFRINNDSGMAYCTTNANGEINRISFKSNSTKIGAGGNVDWSDQPIHLPNNSRYQIIDYDVIYQGELQTIILIKETKTNCSDIINLYWNSDCHYDDLLRIDGNYSTDTRIAIGMEGLYVYHPASCEDC